ncbi:cell wall-binding repeat-containing protein [Herbiconiux sp. VKM Ac-2851]|uniref:cell wall-binding repeat-containing protein n=1 Tax=Herbiconiux sp. VKM Ac-2851 TaxID=2739025 RepID=UPI0015672293|nr:cell wall-binding repeat-containing protein [Herbiconiux sp. VKM Ac-2851]NQX35428.1 family 43 glycosylhydrolase [Herbiconiux sp. VKM Ac-2851]
MTTTQIRPAARTSVRRAAALLTVGAVLAGSAVLAGAATAARAETVNPILSDGSYYSADPATLVDGDTLYVFAGRDEAGPTQNDFVMNEWQTFSTTDVDSGVWQHTPDVMRPEEAFAWATPGRAYAGQAVTGADGRHYWYVPVAQRDPGSADAFAIGVAVADSPAGPWSDAIGAPLISQKILGNDIQNIDPTILTDDDGRVYLYWGTFGQMRAVELDPGMTTLIGEPITVTGTDGFFEAPWIFKRGETYYLAYAANDVGPNCTEAVYHACISYATSPGPMGPWSYAGRVLAPVSSTTSHPAITEFDGRWYIVYHTADAAGGNHFRRSVAIDELNWDDSVSPARIEEVVQTPVKQIDRTPRANIAPWATASASNQPVPAQYWIRALNDELVRPNPLPPDMWGNYSGDRPESEWLQYDWAEPRRIDSSTVDFWRDSEPGSGDGVSNPASWLLQYRDASGDWADVADPSGYGTSTDEPQSVSFAPVTTTGIRLALQASPGDGSFSGLAVEEWEVGAAQPTGYRPVSITTAAGALPELPATVTLDQADGSTSTTPVLWDAIDPVDVSRPGTFSVQGFAEGYAAEEVTAAITVTGDTVPGEDTTAPEVVLAPTSAVPPSGWFRAATTVRASATDDRDLRMRVEVRVDSGAWTATDNTRTVDVPVSDDGETLIEARATDAAGNVSAETALTVRLDRAAPVVTPAVELSARRVSLSASDAGSGVASLEVSLGDRASWAPYTGPVVADATRTEVHYRATDAAGNVSATQSVTIPAADSTPLEGDIAGLATATASYSSPWTQVSWVNDGDASAEAPGWGTWPEVGEQWVQLEWPRLVDVDRADVSFFTDQDESAGAGVIVPRSWRVQYFDIAANDWRDVETAGEYGRDRVAPNSIAFDRVSTDRLRVLMQAWGEEPTQGSSGLREVQVFAAAPVSTAVDRIAGGDRYEVSAATSAAGFPSGASTVYVASGQAFPDALSAAPAATIAKAPVLLTLGDRIPAPILTELKRLDPSKIVIVGGPNAIGKKVEKELGTIGDVTRIGGADRFAASRSIAEAAFPDGAAQVVLATGRTFPDALSAGAAVNGKAPVILIDGAATSLDSATKALLAKLAAKDVVIVGGTDAVTAALADDVAKVATVTRLAGEDRFGSSRAINAFFIEKADRVVLATGANFPDALSGSAFAPAVDAPLFTVQTDCIPADTLTQITALGAQQVTLLGGTTVLSPAVESLTACTT